MADLDNIKQVIEIYSANEVNRYLSVGWILIGTANGKSEEGGPLFKYSLAWNKDSEPAQPTY